MSQTKQLTPATRKSIEKLDFDAHTTPEEEYVYVQIPTKTAGRNGNIDDNSKKPGFLGRCLLNVQSFCSALSCRYTRCFGMQEKILYVLGGIVSILVFMLPCMKLKNQSKTPSIRQK